MIGIGAIERVGDMTQSRGCRVEIRGDSPGAIRLMPGRDVDPLLAEFCRLAWVYIGTMLPQHRREVFAFLAELGFASGTIVTWGLQYKFEVPEQ